MSFDIPSIHIKDNSPEAIAVEQEMRRENVDASSAVRLILSRAADLRTPSRRAIGAFAKDEDCEILEESMRLVQEARAQESTREFGY